MTCSSIVENILKGNCIGTNVLEEGFRNLDLSREHG